MFYTKQVVSSLFKMHPKRLVIALVAIALTTLAWGNLIFHLKINARPAIVENPALSTTIEGINNSTANFLY